jgi:hypothetical protein
VLVGIARSVLAYVVLARLGMGNYRLAGRLGFVLS